MDALVLEVHQGQSLDDRLRPWPLQPMQAVPFAVVNEVEHCFGEEDWAKGVCVSGPCAVDVTAPDCFNKTLMDRAVQMQDPFASLFLELTLMVANCESQLFRIVPIRSHMFCHPLRAAGVQAVGDTAGQHREIHLVIVFKEVGGEEGS